jgi:SNF2 family DNA or RNA helicase
VELLNECLGAGMKVVVFSHYTRMLDLIEKHLTDHNISFCGLRGNMSMGRRHQMIKKFNTDDSCQVFSASLLAGGVGVDLTAAQAVIHYDRWWNAAREDQATARVHRMGQKNVVQVFKMVTVGTLEEKINQMIIRKRTLADHLIKQDDAAIIKRLSRKELIDLLAEPSAGKPRDNTLI